MAGTASPLDSLDQSSVFLAPPSALKIQAGITRDYSSLKVEMLITELKARGPLPAYGQYGPEKYVEPSSIRDHILDTEIYGWAPGAMRSGDVSSTNIFIVGARKIAESGRVYFVMAQGVTTDVNFYWKKYALSPTDSKVYVATFHRFIEHLCDLYFHRQPTKVPMKASVTVMDFGGFESASERFALETAYVQKLTEMTVESAEGRNACRVIGQEIFDLFKSKADGNSLAGKEACQRIHHSLEMTRSCYVDLSWQRIGDAHWTWRS